jgi:hypothetical protein
MNSLVKVISLSLLALATAAEARLELFAARGKLRLDGRLDEEDWARAPSSSSFTQKYPTPGAAPSEVTLVRVVYDRDAVWIGVDCRQSVPVVAQLTRRDRHVEADWVEVSLDTRDDGVSAFVFNVNAAGVLSDGLRFNDTEYSPDWDENWDARVHIDPGGWTAELRIPLRILRFDRLPVQDWGLELRRYISARQETEEWAYVPPTEAGEVSHYGRLRGLYNLKPPGPFELRPFAVGRVRHRDAASAMLASGWDAGGSAGFDAKWHVTQNLTLDATFNPDFAQVEADQVVLNLTNFEIYFPEKRPFFLEGIDAFATLMPIIYTRRIGLAPPAPALRTQAPFGEQLVDVPDATTIYGAAKLVGTLGRRITVAAASALTARNQIEAQLAQGTRQHFTAEPLALYDILRLKLKLGENAHVGFIGTAVNRFEADRYPIVPAGGSNRTYALCPDGNQVQLDARCFHDAYVTGVDFRWRSKGGEWVAQGQAILGAISGGPPRAQLDGNVIGSGDLGGGGQLYIAREGGKHWLFGAEYDAASTRLDYNDLGYMQRQNVHHLFAWLAYRTTEKRGRTLNTKTQLQYNDAYNLTGLSLGRSVQLNSFGQFTNFWSYWAELHYRPQFYDDREVGDGTALERDGLVGAELWLGTDSRKRFYAEIDTLTQVLFDGFHFYGGLHFVLRALPRLDFDLQPNVEYSTGEPRYAGLGTAPGSYLFGKLDALAVSTTLRATFTFTPRLSLQLYAQLFLASKHYRDFSVFATGQSRVVSLDDLRPTTQRPTANPDLEEAAVNLNLVLRWEYLLGSTLFFVYTRGQSPSLSLLPGQEGRLDLGALKRAPASDVLLVKLSYWWG